MKIVAIVPAAGSGRRFGGKTPKQFLSCAGKPLLVHTLKRLGSAYKFSERIVAVSPKEMKRVSALLLKHGLASWRIVAGGATRAESVWNGMNAAGPDVDWVLVHDAARPNVSKHLVRGVIDGAKKTGVALAALPSFATVKKADKKTNFVINTEDRDSIFLAQTPQVAKRRLLEQRYRKLGKKAFSLTDEAAFFDGTPVRVKIVTGEPENIKITTPADLVLFRSSR